MAKKTPGLKQRGKVWHIEKVICGVRVYQSTGTSDLQEAERYLAKVTQEIREGILYGAKERHTIDEACARYLIENQHKRGIARQGFALKPIVEAFGELDISKIRLELFKEYIKDRHVSNATITREFGALRAVLQCCLTKWTDDNGNYWLDRLPSLPSLENDSRKPRPITQEEQRRLFEQLPGYLAEMALFAVNTGCRDQEVCGLRWEWEMELSGSKRTVFLIPGSETKNGKDKIVPLNDVASRVVEAQRGKHPDYVFTFDGHRLDRMNNKAWRKSRQTENLPDVRVHDLRHTFASRLRSLGVRQEDIADLLGHSRGSITAHYSKVTIQRLFDCVDLLCNSESKPELTLVRKRS